MIDIALSMLASYCLTIGVNCVPCETKENGFIIPSCCCVRASEEIRDGDTTGTFREPQFGIKEEK